MRANESLRLAAACGRFWRLHGDLSEGRMHLSAALSKTNSQERTSTRARALTLLANLLYLQSDYPAMRPAAEEALSIWRDLGPEGKAGTAYTLDLLGELATEEGDYVHPPALFQEAMDIYKELDDKRGMGQIHMQFGWAALRTGDYARAQSHLEHAGYGLVEGLDYCFDNPGTGGMGFHYINTDLLDTTVDLLHPEAMVYTPSPNGLQLGAVEYIVPQEAWDATGSAEPPMLMDQRFHLNSSLHVYVLHAWIWKNNKAGVFEDWNPTVSCPS